MKKFKEFLLEKLTSISIQSEVPNAISRIEPNALPKVVVKEDKKTDRKKSDTSIAVYDIEAKGWRSFTIRSIKKFEFKI